MRTKLTTEEREKVIPQIQKVLETGKEWEDEDLHCPVEALINELESMGFEKDSSMDSDLSGRDGFDTNGWQYDWWQYFKYEGKSYVLNGCGYYGGLSFGLNE